MEQLLPIRKLLGKRDGADQAHATLAAALDRLRVAGKMMIAEAKQKKDEPDFAAQIAYEAGGCWRTVAEYEAEAARMAAQEEAQRMKQRAKQKLAATTRPVTQPTAQPAILPGQESQKAARACYEMSLEIAPDSATASEARAAMAELAEAKPSQPTRRKSLNIASATRVELPAVLNGDGGAEFPRLEPLVRSNSADLSNEEGSSLDEGLLNRRFSFPEDAVAMPAGRN